MDISKLFNPKDELPYITFVVFLFSFVTISLFWITPQLCTAFLELCVKTNLGIPDAVRNALLLVDIVFLVIVSIKTKASLMLRFKRGRSRYVFTSRSWPKGWIFNGGPEIIDGNLHVKSSRAGMLLEKFLWKDFRMTFEMKFDRNLYLSEHVGVVFRARDLDNYFMLEIRGGDVPGIAPHVRFKSGWEDTGKKIIRDLDFEEFREIAIEAIGDTVILSYRGGEIFSWILPTHADISHFESGVDGDTSSDESATLSKNLSGNHVQKIPFRLEYGMIGFRAHHLGQGAIVRNLKIEPL